MPKTAEEQLGLTFEVFCQRWEEDEHDGWGARNDGCSLHLTPEDAKLFYENWKAKMPAYVTACYEPAGKPRRCKVDAETYEKIKASKCGLRFKSCPPCSGKIKS